MAALHKTTRMHELHKRVELVCVVLVCACVMVVGQTSCTLPDCKPPTTRIPGYLHKGETPRIVAITVQGKVDAEFIRTMRRTFPVHPPLSRRNPNGCPMTYTAFVKTTRSDDCAVNRVWATGHEVAVAAEYLNDYEDKSRGNLKTERYVNAISDALNRLQKAAGVEDVYGARNVGLYNKANYTEAVHQLELEYDSTVRVLDEDNTTATALTFPYTMDNALDAALSCGEYKCPEAKYNLMWQIPMLGVVYNDVNYARVTDIPDIIKFSEYDVLNILQENFERHFSNSRVPLLLDFRYDELKKGGIVKGLNKFLDLVSIHYDDVWAVTLHQVLDWVRNPHRLGELYRYGDWKCEARSLLDCRVEGLDPKEDNYTKSENGTEKFDSLNIQDLFPGGYYLVYWQTALLIGAYFFIVLYDKYGIKSK